MSAPAIADRIDLAVGSTIGTNGADLVTLRPTSANRLIEFGSMTEVAVGTLELSDAELDTITAFDVLRIGASSNLGNIQFTAPISPAGTDTLTLSAGTETFTIDHTYKDDHPSGTPADSNPILVTVTDADGETVVDASQAVLVNNLAPFFTSLSLDPTSVVAGSQATFSGTYSDPGVEDTHLIDVDLNGDGTPDFPAVPVSGESLSFDVAFNLSPGTYTVNLTLRDDDGGATSGATGVVEVTVLPPSGGAIVLESRPFYNNSTFDGNDPAGNAADLSAIDPSKVPATIGQPTTSASITSYVKGLNGVTFRVSDLPNDGANLSPADFAVHVGATSNLNTWAAGPTPAVTVLPNVGVGGGDRILLVFPDHSIRDTYAAIQMLAGTNTDLAQPHTAIFGSVVADTGFATAAVDEAVAEAASFPPADGLGSPTTPQDGRVDESDNATESDLDLAFATFGNDDPQVADMPDTLAVDSAAT